MARWNSTHQALSRLHALLIYLDASLNLFTIFTAGPGISFTRFVSSSLPSKMISSFASDVGEVLEPHPAELSAGLSEMTVVQLFGICHVF
ncbi:hypothetical protein RB195_014215 [Necator americanus]|uniref:Uncharacterized protein n=1 Tax=Necator americanus TaxID=51031 RepID=A0ABR1DZA0_NECAM